MNFITALFNLPRLLTELEAAITNQIKQTEARIMAKKDEQTQELRAHAETLNTSLQTAVEAAVTAETAQVLDAIANSDEGFTPEQMQTIKDAMGAIGGNVVARIQGVYGPSTPPTPQP